VTLGDHVRIGHLNIIRGGDEVNLARYSELLRLNEIKLYSRPEVVIRLIRASLWAPGASFTTGHKIDFTDRVDIGRRAIIGGRNSSVWDPQSAANAACQQSVTLLMWDLNSGAPEVASRHDASSGLAP